ncbi:hypothetical protein [Archaeoglobus sulfaticallidus]|uniref:hypothetical protein n=1 Tax=Archaeoglobus sulfaticallidus TaxID=1316941 RepID=UPI0015D035CE|nr:hypothetical protein [Archaeoglobus sulfaticallidus]
MVAANAANAIEITVTPSKVVGGNYYIVKGDAEKITVTGSPNQVVQVSLTCKFTVSASSGKYDYKIDSFPIPLDVDSVSVKAYRVNNLRLKTVFFIFPVYVPTSGPKVADSAGYATVSINQRISKGSYDIEIFGDTNYTQVTIEATVKSTIALDSSGKYELVYDTSKIPIGELHIVADDKSFKAFVVGSSSEIPEPTPTSTPTPTPVPTTPTPTPTSNPEPTPTPTKPPATSIPTTPTPTPTSTPEPTPTSTPTPTPVPTTPTPTPEPTPTPTSTPEPTPTSTPTPTPVPTTPTPTPEPTPTPVLYVPGFTHTLLIIAAIVSIKLISRK